jgi:hypothetical protein
MVDVSYSDNIIAARESAGCSSLFGACWALKSLRDPRLGLPRLADLTTQLGQTMDFWRSLERPVGLEMSACERSAGSHAHGPPS